MRERLAALIADIDGIEAVTQAPDGAAALAAIAIGAPDIVVLDLQMPRIDGFGVLKSLRRTTPLTTAIVISNHVDYRQYALRAGAAFFFEKATELDGLLGRVADIAASRPSP
jgi:DNA-binding NarL/FixJ family response regulator